jgi:quinol monooxygenase YgiN
MIMYYEVRTEHANAGQGRELAQYFDETVVPLHQELGMQVVGTFTAVDDPDAFVWIRRFEDDAEREGIVDAVHRDPRFKAVVERVTVLSGGRNSTHRLTPTARSGLE